MDMNQVGIQHKICPQTLFAAKHLNLSRREEMLAAIHQIKEVIPVTEILDSPRAIIQFITSFEEGFDVWVGFPVRTSIQAEGLQNRVLPQVDVLSIIHDGSAETLGESYRRLYGWTEEHGLISDEYGREIFLEADPDKPLKMELQFVLHDWFGLLSDNVGRVLGRERQREIMRGVEELHLDTTASNRFQWLKRAMSELDRRADEDQMYDIVSSCAHVFPREHILKLGGVYDETLLETGDPMASVEAVMDWMGRDRAFGERPQREGNVIFSSKKPRDPKGYEAATSDLEKRRAYCFCPLVRNHIDQGMPERFCYCGAGWYRQQWEGAIGQPVWIEIVQTLLRGDPKCEFAIHLPDDF